MGKKSTMGESLLYGKYSREGKHYYTANFPGDKPTLWKKLLHTKGPWTKKILIDIFSHLFEF